jgi:5-(carboxyamino)imidazole ribonucleotide synthase
MGNPRVGIIGAGQLGRMMALAGYPLGVEIVFLDASADTPGGRVGRIHVAALDDMSALEALAAEVDVLTFDIENVAVPALRRLAQGVPVLPQPDIVELAQDRVAEKDLFQSMGIPTAPFVAIAEQGDLERAAAALTFPLVIKARRLGYDGRGQRVVEIPEKLDAAWQDIGRVPAIAETWMKFDCEVSLIGARSADGRPRFYPLAQNWHEDGILFRSMAPFENGELKDIAEGWLTEIMNRFDYRGVLTVEFFVTQGGLVANEMAPRVHNSGHWTIEGAQTSQFENHLRAVLGWPLGDTTARGHAGMVNFLGGMPASRDVLALEGAHLHDYGKAPRPARKLGHATMVAAKRDVLMARLATLETLARASKR